MDWAHVTSEVELRKLGSYQVVKDQIMYDVDPFIKIKSRSWKELYEQVVSLQELSYQLLVDELQELQQFREEKAKLTAISRPEYFISYADAYIFYLLELDGRERMKRLGIVKSMYAHPDKAKLWYRGIAQVIHPEISHHPKAAEAMSCLNEIYFKMIYGE